MKKRDLLPEKSQLPILNLDEELFERNNTAAAFHIIISGLIKNKEQRNEILLRVKPDYLDIAFIRYLFEIVAEDLTGIGEINIDSIIESIPEFEPRVYGRKSKRRSLKTRYFTLAQILDFEPTPAQVSKAIDMIVAWANSEYFQRD